MLASYKQAHYTDFPVTAVQVDLSPNTQTQTVINRTKLHRIFDPLLKSFSSCYYDERKTNIYVIAVHYRDLVPI